MAGRFPISLVPGELHELMDAVTCGSKKTFYFGLVLGDSLVLEPAGETVRGSARRAPAADCFNTSAGSA